MSGEGWWQNIYARCRGGETDAVEEREGVGVVEETEQQSGEILPMVFGVVVAFCIAFPFFWSTMWNVVESND